MHMTHAHAVSWPAPLPGAYLDHPLVLTDDMRALLAVIAPWLATQQPFVLVRLGAACLQSGSMLSSAHDVHAAAFSAPAILCCSA